MSGIPDTAQETLEFLQGDVLHELELEPEESREIVSYLNQQHHYLFGPHNRYFVLGSYDRPFKFRLEMVADELNHRHNAYAYLMAPLPDPDLPDAFPTLKLKFYLHAIYADYILLVLEHNTGGALTEFGRVDRQFLFERTHVYPRAKEAQYEDATVHGAPSQKGSWEWRNLSSAVRGRVIELAYEASDDLDEKLAELVEEIDDDYHTVDKLRTALEGELGDHIPPDYSGVLTDGFTHFERVGRCHSWTTRAQLRGEFQKLP